MSDSLVELKLALEVESQWRRRADELSSPSSIAAYLQEVVATVPFFRTRLGGMPCDELKLQVFPVVRRDSYIERREEFVTSQGRSSTLVMWTNGTLGSPLAVRFDAVGWYDLNYGSYDTLGTAYPEILSRMRAREDGVFLISNVQALEEFSSYVPTLDLAVLRQLVFGRSAAGDEGIIARLRASRVPLLYGKPSTLVELAAADQASATAHQRIRPFAVLVSGEALYEDQREMLQTWFNTKVINAYIATEGGLIALECPFKTGLHVRNDRVRVEVLVSGGQIEETGQGELLLTNPMNRGQAFVRYAIGDEVEVVRAPCSCGFNGATITKLQGRESAHVMLSSGPVPATTFTEFLLALQLKEFQVYQEGNHPPWLKWIPAEGSGEGIAEIAQKVDAWLRARGWQSQIASIPVGRITPVGGKHRRCVRIER